MTDVVDSEEFEWVMMLEYRGKSDRTPEPTMNSVLFNGNSASINQDISSAISGTGAIITLCSRNAIIMLLPISMKGAAMGITA